MVYRPAPAAPTPAGESPDLVIRLLQQNSTPLSTGVDVIRCGRFRLVRPAALSNSWARCPRCLTCRALVPNWCVLVRGKVICC